MNIHRVLILLAAATPFTAGQLYLLSGESENGGSWGTAVYRVDSRGNHLYSAPLSGSGVGKPRLVANDLPLNVHYAFVKH
ncbi:MAG TPA: hypothetical protein VML19_00355 [Verrucomicrobiae bacterium]|nr:hypothetical protein [Verrucomicrobiae bacterium]